MPTRFDIVIDSKRLSASKLSTFLQEMMAYVTEVDRAMSPEGRLSAELFVASLSYNSPARIGLSARPRRKGGRDTTRQLVRACARGIREIGRSSEHLLSDDALRHLQVIAGHLNDDTSRVTVEIPTDRESSAITKDTASQIERLLRRQVTMGGVEGLLEALNIHNDYFFTVWDAVSGKAVRCFFDEHDLSAVQDGLGHKVLVQGRIRRDEDGHPSQVRPVRTFRVIDTSRPLPNLVGLFSGMQDSRDYLEMIRGE